MYQRNQFLNQFFNKSWRRVGRMTLTTVVISALWILQFYLISLLQVSPASKGNNVDRAAFIGENLGAAINAIPQLFGQIYTILPSASI